MDQTIALLSLECQSNFEILTKSIDTDESTSQTHLSSMAIVEELGRFRIWASNIGASNVGKASLDYRLRDAEYLFHNVKSLLENLSANLIKGFTAPKKWLT
jgi:hypothetical protein